MQTHGIHPAKCVLGVDSVDFLEHNVTADGLLSLPQKGTAIQDFPKPSSIQQVRAFFGVVNCYHIFLSNAVDTLRPLNDTLVDREKSAQKTLAWTPEGEKSLVCFERALQTRGAA